MVVLVGWAVPVHSKPRCTVGHFFFFFFFFCLFYFLLFSIFFS